MLWNERSRKNAFPRFSFSTTIQKTDRSSPVRFIYASEALQTSCIPSLLTVIPAKTGITVARRRRVLSDAPALRLQPKPHQPKPPDCEPPRISPQ